MLTLKPKDALRFEGPFDKVSTTFLELSNTSHEKRVGFKVKTTAPRRYCVRPNSGIVEPGGEVRIAIMLQPIDIESSQEDLRKHKFMVQSVVLSDNDVNLEQLWKTVSPVEVTDAKIRCSFDKISSSGANDKTGSSPTRSRSPASSNVLKEATKSTLSEHNKPNESRKDTPQTSDEIERLKHEVETLRKTNEYLQSLKKIQEPSYENASSSQNLSTSMQSLHEGDTKTMFLIAFVVLVIGLILGKYII